jgi:hypothetical protein
VGRRSRGTCQAYTGRSSHRHGPLPQKLKAQRRMLKFYKHMACALLVTATTRETTMSSMKIMIHERRVVNNCSSLKSIAETPCTPLLTSILHLFGFHCKNSFSYQKKTPTFHLELQSCPCKNQATMVSRSYNNLLDLATSTWRTKHRCRPHVVPHLEAYR